MDRGGHTELDFETFTRLGVDPTSTQPRERAVQCWVCGRETFNQAAACDDHYEVPHSAKRRT